MWEEENFRPEDLVTPLIYFYIARIIYLFELCFWMVLLIFTQYFSEVFCEVHKHDEIYANVL